MLHGSKRQTLSRQHLLCPLPDGTYVLKTVTDKSIRTQSQSPPCDHVRGSDVLDVFYVLPAQGKHGSKSHSLPGFIAGSHGGLCIFNVLTFSLGNQSRARRQTFDLNTAESKLTDLNPCMTDRIHKNNNTIHRPRSGLTMNGHKHKHV